MSDRGETRELRLMSPLAALMLLVGAGAIYAAVTLAVTGGSRDVAGVLGVSGLVLFMSGLGYNRRWRRHRWFYRRFRTYEQFRADNLDDVRRVWNEKGSREAVRHLKIHYPRLPNAHRLRLLQELRDS